jgi:ADP-heptose:LPS heptosyltransferase
MQALERVRRVLVIRHRAAGDLLLTTPALRALRLGLPTARIEVLTARGMGELLEGNPDIDSVLEFDRRSIGSQAALYARLLRGGWDLVLDLVSNPRSAWMTALTRARARAGYAIPGRSWAYTRSISREPRSASGPILRYAPEGALDLVRALGLPSRGVELTFRVSPRAERSMEDWLEAQGERSSRPLLACLPAGSWLSKTWPAERFATAMDALSEQGTVVWLWGPEERRLAESCRERMQSPSLLAPEIGWQELGALIRRSSLWVGNDSGPKHLAVALGVPTVTIFGPTHPTTWHPPEGPHVALFAEGLECLHCNANRCPLPGERHMRCMRDVTPDQVVLAARTLLHERRAVSCASR